MKIDCTDIFRQYREIARLVWNAGFWPNPKLRDWDATILYKEISARFFEGMVLLALGYEGRIEDADCPGQIAEFQLVAKHGGVELRVDKNSLPNRAMFGAYQLFHYRRIPESTD
jgi:hypothetical protein